MTRVLVDMSVALDSMPDTVSLANTPLAAAELQSRDYSGIVSGPNKGRELRTTFLGLSLRSARELRTRAGAEVEAIRR